MFQRYRDARAVKRYYPNMKVEPTRNAVTTLAHPPNLDMVKAYMTCLEKQADPTFPAAWPRHGPKLRPQTGTPCDWLSLDATSDEGCVATILWYYDALMMAEMAAGIGRKDDAEAYGELATGIQAAWQARMEFI